MSASYERHMEYLRSQQQADEHVTTPVTIAHCHVSDGAIYQAASRRPDLGYHTDAEWDEFCNRIRELGELD